MHTVTDTHIHSPDPKMMVSSSVEGVTQRDSTVQSMGTFVTSKTSTEHKGELWECKDGVRGRGEVEVEEERETEKRRM